MAEALEIDETVTMFWRPGCGFCAMLERGLLNAGVEFERRNIWDDPEAAEFVRTMNNGNETVPTVVIGTDVYSNPTTARILARLGVEEPDGPFKRLLNRS
jgi:glutaredoxin